MAKEQRKKDGKKTPKSIASANQDVPQTAEEHDIKSSKSTETYGIDGSLVGKKDGSREPKRYKDVKITRQINL